MALHLLAEPLLEDAPALIEPLADMVVNQLATRRFYHTPTPLGHAAADAIRAKAAATGKPCHTCEVHDLTPRRATESDLGFTERVQRGFISSAFKQYHTDVLKATVLVPAEMLEPIHATFGRNPDVNPEPGAIVVYGRKGSRPLAFLEQVQ